MDAKGMSMDAKCKHRPKNSLLLQVAELNVPPRCYSPEPVKPVSLAFHIGIVTLPSIHFGSLHRFQYCLVHGIVVLTCLGLSCLALVQVAALAE